MDDPRLTPGAAAISPRNISKARSRPTRFVDGEEFEIADAIAPLRAAPSADAALTDAGAEGRARHHLRPQRRRLGLGPAWTATAMSAGCRTPRWRNLRRGADAQGHRAAHLRVSRAVDQAAAGRGAADGRGVAVAREDGAFAVTTDGWYLPRRHLGAARCQASRISSRSPSASSARPICGAARAASASTAPAWCRFR